MGWGLIFFLRQRSGRVQGGIYILVVKDGDGIIRPELALLLLLSLGQVMFKAAYFVARKFRLPECPSFSKEGFLEGVMRCEIYRQRQQTTKSRSTQKRPRQKASSLFATIRLDPTRLHTPTPVPVAILPPGPVPMSNSNQDQDHLESIFKQKRILRSKVRQALKSMDPSLRSQEDDIIQSIVLESPWFKSSKRLCAYISCSGLREVDTSKLLSQILHNPSTEGSILQQTAKKLYVPRVEDKNGNMRMFNISRIDDLVANSMNILEPASVDADGNEREDVMHANDPVDLFILPGLAFDKSGRRLGRGGGYYDAFLKNYKELAKERNWRQPLFVALSYSVQIMDDEVIPFTPNDVLVDALVSASGVIPISPAALERLKTGYELQSYAKIIMRMEGHWNSILCEWFNVSTNLSYLTVFRLKFAHLLAAKCKYHGALGKLQLEDMLKRIPYIYYGFLLIKHAVPPTSIKIMRPNFPEVYFQLDADVINTKIQVQVVRYWKILCCLDLRSYVSLTIGHTPSRRNRIESPDRYI
ncbi:hypothetical protein PTKIN_Ptkin05aG0163200 [Pterospermum kingtungense]